jgi:hypothetical protein
MCLVSTAAAPFLRAESAYMQPRVECLSNSKPALLAVSGFNTCMHATPHAWHVWVTSRQASLTPCLPACLLPACVSSLYACLPLHQVASAYHSPPVTMCCTIALTCWECLT